jgi:hypothetical protein
MIEQDLNLVSTRYNLGTVVPIRHGPHTTTWYRVLNLDQSGMGGRQSKSETQGYTTPHPKSHRSETLPNRTAVNTSELP